MQLLLFGHCDHFMLSEEYAISTWSFVAFLVLKIFDCSSTLAIEMLMITENIWPCT